MSLHQPDMSRIVDAIVVGFAADPFTRWVFDNPQLFLGHFPEAVGHFGGRALEHGTAFHTKNYEGAALWLPPDIHPDEEKLGELFEKVLAAEKLSLVLAAFGEMEQYYPQDPFWHLAFLSVDPTKQGKGHGARLMEQALEEVDAAGQYAYLESTNPRNLSLYERYGFELARPVTNEVTALIPMVRKPR